MPKGTDFSETGYPYIRARDIRDGRVTFNNPVFVNDHVRSKIRNYTVRSGDICITIVGINIGDTGIIPPFLDKANLTENAAKITNLVDCDPSYLNLYLQTSGMKEQMQLLSSGAAQDKLGLYKIKLLDVFLPPVPTQRKIAAILTAYDDLIETNKRRIALLEKMAEELYREWFVRMRFPGCQNTKFIKGVPEGWKETSLGKIAFFTMGQSPKSEFYNEIGAGLPFHQGVGTYGDRFPRKITFCTVDGRRAQAGDILFSVRAPVGRLNIADCEMIIGRGLAAIRHRRGRNSYLFYLLKVIFSNEDIIGNGSIFNSVGKDELSRFGLHGPPEILVDEFEKIVSPIDRHIKALIHSIANLTQTRDLLLPRLISGKLSVENLDIQMPPSMREEAD